MTRKRETKAEKTLNQESGRLASLATVNNPISVFALGVLQTEAKRLINDGKQEDEIVELLREYIVNLKNRT